MKTKIFLLPNKYRTIGGIVLMPAIVFWITVFYFEFRFDFLTIPIKSGDNIFPGISGDFINFTDELATLLIILSLFMIGFSKEKVEDEMTSHIRLDALHWSVYCSYLILIVLILFIHGLDFLNVMMYNMFTVLIVFVVRFNYLKFKLRKELRA